MPALNAPAVSARVSNERPAVRWIILACVWVLVFALALADTLAVRDYVAMLDDSGTLPTDVLPLRRPVLGPYADAQTWTRLAIASDTSGAWQIRHTQIDNAPGGRAVHWSSTFVHLIAWSGRLRAAVTNEALPRATENALAWINLPLLLGVIMFFSAWIAGRMGAMAGALVALGMIGHRWFYDGFAPNYVDHHGLLTASTFGCIAGAMFIPIATGEDAVTMRGAALLSAIAGGLGVWLSAASVIPTILVVGGAAMIVAAARRPRLDAQSARTQADLWRLWSRLGALISVVGYLAEYAPAHFGLRLEVNHPLYAFAWLGGGELIAWVIERRAGVTEHRTWRVVAAAALVALPPIIIVVGGARVFLPSDPAVSRLHDFIDEFASLTDMARRIGFPFIERYVLSLVLLLPALLLVRSGRGRPQLLFASIVAIALSALGCWQIRWWLPAGAAELCLLLAAIATAAESVSSRVTRSIAVILGLVFVEQSVARTLLTRRNVAEGAVTDADAMQPLFRDVAAALRHSQATGPITVLSSPDASSAIGYFGGFQSIGTLYWENRDGLTAAAKMLASSSDDEVLADMRARGVTHVALFSAGNFLDAYLAALSPKATTADLHRTFGWRVLFDRHVPRWLQAIPFIPRPGSPSKIVLLFRVVPEQGEFDAQWAAGIALAAAGDDSLALATLTRAIALAPASQRMELIANAARETYRWRAHRVSLALFEQALAVDRSPATILAIGWLLATSPDDVVRNGPRAVALVEPLARSSPGAGGVLDTYAAALAEAGRFGDAVRAEAGAIDNARHEGDAAGVARGSERLRSYQAGRPWRQ
jgi:hypothetical protein